MSDSTERSQDTRPHRHRTHLTYANIMATIAVVGMLGGTATAAALVTGKQIKDATVTSVDVRNRSLRRIDFKNGQIPRGQRGEQGPKGDPTYAAIVHVQATGDEAANGVRLRTALATAGSLAVSTGIEEDENVVVQLEPGTFEISSELSIPASVSIVGSGIRESRIVVAASAFTGDAVLGFVTQTNGRRSVSHLTVLAQSWTSGSASEVRGIEMGSDLSFVQDVFVGMQPTSGITTVRGIVAGTGSGRVEIADSHIDMSGSIGTTQVGIGSAALGDQYMVHDVKIEVDGSSSSSAAVQAGSGYVELHSAVLEGNSSALAIGAVGGAVLSYGSYITGSNLALSSTSNGQVTLYGGSLQDGTNPSEATGGQVTCFDVANGSTDASTFVAKTTCA